MAAMVRGPGRLRPARLRYDGARLVAELVPAIRAPDGGVRNNVMRVLADIAL
jgi:hypothetical protein